MVLATYSTTRRLTKEGAVSQATHTLRGIIAGCGMATTCLRVVLVRALDSHARQWRELPLRVFTDDTTMSKRFHWEI